MLVLHVSRRLQPVALALVVVSPQALASLVDLVLQALQVQLVRLVQLVLAASVHLVA